jgi:hypothetical protein
MNVKPITTIPEAKIVTELASVLHMRGVETAEINNNCLFRNYNVINQSESLFPKMISKMTLDLFGWNLFDYVDVNNFMGYFNIRNSASLIYHLQFKHLSELEKAMKDNKKDPIVESVREKLLQRSQVGIHKYSTTLLDNKKDNYLNHLQQELLDGANYIETLLQQKKDITQLIKKYNNDGDLGAKIREIYS